MSTNLEKLKQELLLQKEVITSKGGTTIVANENPSPSEITAGIQSIEMPDLSQTTATINDVRTGKTFYSGDLFIKTGVMPQPYTDEVIQALFSYEDSATTTDTIYYTFPADTKKVRSYLFYRNPNSAHITLSENTEEICDYAFYSTDKFKILNINELPKIRILGTYALQGAVGIDHANLWPTLTNAGIHCLTNTIYDNTCINLPALKTIGSYSFTDTVQKRYLSHIDFSKVEANSINSYAFANLVVSGDLTFSKNTTVLSSYSFYKGSHKSVTIPATMKQVLDNCFGGSSSDATDTYKIKEFIFESETPPTIGTTIISTYHVDNGLKIYVPDTAVETYKAVPKLANYVDIILPMSQKP